MFHNLKTRIITTIAALLTSGHDKYHAQYALNSLIHTGSGILSTLSECLEIISEQRLTEVVYHSYES